MPARLIQVDAILRHIDQRRVIWIKLADIYGGHAVASG